MVMLALIAATSVVWSVAHVSLWQAPEWGDEGHYVFAGWRILQGQRLYLDFYDGAQKPPMIYWTAAAVVKLLGRNASVWPAFRVITILTKLGAVLLVFSLGRMLVSRRAGLIAAALFGFNSLAVVIGNQVMTEPYSTLLALLGLWLFLRSGGWLKARDGIAASGRQRGGRWNYPGFFAAGLCIGVGMLYRPTPIFLGLAIGIAMLAQKEARLTKLQRLGLFVTGVAAGLMPLVLYLAINKGFVHFYVMVVRFMMKYPSTSHPLKVRLGYLTRSFFWPGGCRWLIAFALAAALFHTLRRKSLPGLVLGGWLGLQVILILVTLRQVEWHYLYELLPGFVLLVAFGFERLLALANEVYVRLKAKQRLYWLLDGGRPLFLVTTVLLPVPLLVLFFHLRWAAIEWRAGISADGHLHAARWPLVVALIGGALVISWGCRQKWYVFLVAMVFCLPLVLRFPSGEPLELAVPGGLVTVCFMFACGGWLWRISEVLRRQFETKRQGRLAGLVRQAAARMSNSLVIILWLFLIWLVAGQAQAVVKFGPKKTRMRDAQAAANYIRDNLREGERILSCTGEINFLLGKSFPTYWGYHHEQVAVRVGIDKMVGRELADVVSYCQKHRVRFIVFARGLNPARMGGAGEEFIRQNFRAEKWFGTYAIYARRPYFNAG